MTIPINTLFEVTVNGSIRGQMCANVLHYRIENAGDLEANSTEETLESLITLFRGHWRDQVLPIVSMEYKVAAYRIAIVDGRDAFPGHVPPFRLRYGAQHILAGVDETDWGTEDDAPLPSFTAIGIRKVAEAVGRNFRGQVRIAGTMKTDTDATEVNRLNTASYDQYVTLGNALMNTPNTDDAAPLRRMHMVVFARTKYLTAGGVGPLPSSFISRVGSMVTNRFLTTQVTRKERFRLV